MRILALTLAIAATATTAQAGDSFSLLRCGLNLGSKTVTYETGADTKRKRDSRLNHVIGTRRTEPLRLGTSAAETTHKREVRLPAKITVATVGCSWR